MQKIRELYCSFSVKIPFLMSSASCQKIHLLHGVDIEETLLYS